MSLQTRTPLVRKTPMKRTDINRNPEPKPDRVSAHQHVNPKDQRESYDTKVGRADYWAGKDCHTRAGCEAQGRVGGHYCRGNLEWAHLAGRDDKSVRWDPENCLLLCEGFHALIDASLSAQILFLDAFWPGRWAAILNARRADLGALDIMDRADAWVAYYKALRTDPNAPKPSFAVVWEAVK